MKKDSSGREREELALTGQVDSRDGGWNANAMYRDLVMVLEEALVSP